MKNIFDSVKANKRKVFIGISLVFSMFLIAFASYNVNKLFANLSGDETPVNTAFDDINFYKCVVDNFNNQRLSSDEKDYKTYKLSDDELRLLGNLLCSSKNIKSIKGIEKLYNLKFISIDNNKIENLDLSSNTLLKSITAKSNLIENVSISSSENLTSLNLDNNYITNIDTSKYINLEKLTLSNNKISSIDLTNNEKLKTLNLEKNKLANINLSTNNELTLLNLNNLNLTDETLSSEDISNKHNIEELYIDGNSLTSINLSNFSNLKKFSAKRNKISAIDVNNNPLLSVLDMTGNLITNIDLKNNPLLSTLDMTGNSLTNIDLKNNKNLTHLILSGNKITSIDLSQNILLSELYYEGNNVENIDLSHNTALTILDLISNKITSINLSYNTSLITLYLAVNNISSIDLSHNLDLEKLNISYNKLKSLALSNNKKINYLDTVGVDDNNFKEDIPILNVGDTYTLSGNAVLPQNFSLNYKISDESIATINDKKITALKNGKTELIITDDGHGYTRMSIVVGPVELTSKEYIVDNKNKVVYTKRETDSNIIKKNLTANVGDIVVENNKVKVVNDSKTLLEYDIVYYNSDYQIKENYLLVKDDIFDENKIHSNSGNLTFTYNKENNKVDVVCNGSVIDTLKISSYHIKDYEVIKDDKNNKYIYLKDKTFDESKIKVINCNYAIVDNKIIIKAGDNILDEIYLSSISIKDSKYGIEDSSIYTDTNDLNKDDIICINGGVEGAGDYTYKIIVAGKVVDTISVIKLDISDESKKDTINKYGYMYVGIRKATELSDFKVINGYIEETNDKLIIYTSNDKKHIIKTIKLLKISSDKYDLVGGYSKKDNGYYIYTKSIDLNSIKMSEELIIKSKNDGDYVIALKTDNTEFESLYASYIMEDSSYKLKDDKVYYGLRSNKNLTLKVKNGYAQKNNDEFDIYLNNGKKTDYMKIIALITDYVSDNNYDFKNGVLDLGDDVFNPLHITDKINADIEYSTKDNVLKILHDGKVVGQIKIKSKANIKKTITTTTSKVTNTTSSTTKVSTTTTTTTKLETRSNRITTKNVGNKNSSCSKCKMLKVFTLSLIILYILYLIYIIYTFKKERDEKQ